MVFESIIAKRRQPENSGMVRSSWSRRRHTTIARAFAESGVGHAYKMEHCSERLGQIRDAYRKEPHERRERLPFVKLAETRDHAENRRYERVSRANGHARTGLQQSGTASFAV
jgi:hypothetical protein